MGQPSYQAKPRLRIPQAETVAGKGLTVAGKGTKTHVHLRDVGVLIYGKMRRSSTSVPEHGAGCKYQAGRAGVERGRPLRRPCSRHLAPLRWRHQLWLSFQTLHCRQAALSCPWVRPSAVTVLHIRGLWQWTSGAAPVADVRG